MERGPDRDSPLGRPDRRERDLARIRRILSGDQCFVVVSDGYRTETTELADVVLPAALWAEKTGTYTNVDRTVHLQEQAVEPPGRARGDQAIFTEYARRPGLSDEDGRPLPPWDTPEEAFEAWKAASPGRPCDYSGLSYQKVHEAGGIQWPWTGAAPQGTERIYADGVFHTDADTCESFGHDLATGAPASPVAYRARHIEGRATLKAPKDSPRPEPARPVCCATCWTSTSSATSSTSPGHWSLRPPAPPATGSCSTSSTTARHGRRHNSTGCASA
ncbi:molybdopterin-dependent oxidoreductase [Streptomyces sp. NPDC001852]|uniref:molybdopterin-dependent oxidoreductase n=1 Tax=Streptomyces sp. NPDC001852 TaxID=3364619 RepID=UPI0036A5F74C